MPAGHNEPQVISIQGLGAQNIFIFIIFLIPVKLFFNKYIMIFDI